MVQTSFEALFPLAAAVLPSMNLQHIGGLRSEHWLIMSRIISFSESRVHVCNAVWGGTSADPSSTEGSEVASDPGSVVSGETQVYDERDRFHKGGQVASSGSSGSAEMQVYMEDQVESAPAGSDEESDILDGMNDVIRQYFKVCNTTRTSVIASAWVRLALWMLNEHQHKLRGLRYRAWVRKERFAVQAAKERKRWGHNKKADQNKCLTAAKKHRDMCKERLDEATSDVVR